MNAACRTVNDLVGGLAGSPVLAPSIPRVSVLIGIAPPVARDGYTFPHTLETTKPKFLVQGDLDELCPLKELWAFYARLKDPKELVVIDGASHLFDGKTREVGEALEDLLGDFEQ